MKAYYMANNEHIDDIYGAENPVCIDMTEVKRLAREWGVAVDDLLGQMHEASEDEIAEYGAYNG